MVSAVAGDPRRISLSKNNNNILKHPAVRSSHGSSRGHIENQSINQ